MLKKTLLLVGILSLAGCIGTPVEHLELREPARVSMIKPRPHSVRIEKRAEFKPVIVKQHRIEIEPKSRTVVKTVKSSPSLVKTVKEGEIKHKVKVVKLKKSQEDEEKAELNHLRKVAKTPAKSRRD